MTLRIPAKVLTHVWSYYFYDMTLSTGKQRRHMIKAFIRERNPQKIVAAAQSRQHLVSYSTVLSNNHFHENEKFQTALNGGLAILSIK